MSRNQFRHFLAAASAVAVGVCLAPPAYADTFAYVSTVSGRVRCMVSGTGVGTGGNVPAVICEASGMPPSYGGTNVGFTQAPINPEHGWHYHAAVVDASGNFSFQDVGNIGGGGGSDLVLQYGQAYTVRGWKIAPSPDGTRFTNAATGHGMFVSIDNVYAF